MLVLASTMLQREQERQTKKSITFHFIFTTRESIKAIATEGQDHFIAFKILHTCAFIDLTCVSLILRAPLTVARCMHQSGHDNISRRIHSRLLSEMKLTFWFFNISTAITNNSYGFLQPAFPSSILCLPHRQGNLCQSVNRVS